jgi:hypothetical protein
MLASVYGHHLFLITKFNTGFGMSYIFSPTLSMILDLGVPRKLHRAQIWAISKDA